jgi:hypothetical protein
VRVTGQRTVRDYAQTIRWLCDKVYLLADIIVLVQDNLTPASLYEAFPPFDALRFKERIEWHYTPKHGSWLNMNLKLEWPSGYVFCGTSRKRA